MKKQKIDAKLVYVVFVLCVVQVCYFIYYCYHTRNDENGIISLFVAILAMEFLVIFTYGMTVFRRLTRQILPAIYSLKLDDGSPLVSSSFMEVDEVVRDVKEHFEAEKAADRKKLELMTACLESKTSAEAIKNGLPLMLEITKADAGAYYYVNNGTNKLEIMESFGFSNELYKVMDIEVGEGLEGTCCKSLRTCVLSGEERDEKYKASSAFFGAIFKNVMAVPVVDGEDCVGVITLAYKGSLQKRSIAAAEEIASLMVSAHNSNLRQEKYRRQKNELELQNSLIQDVTAEIKKKDAEIEELKNLLRDKG